MNFVEYSIHLWTVSFEAQYYLLIAWLILWVGGKTKEEKRSIIGALLVVGLIVQAVFIYFRASSTAIYVLPITHFESVLAGIFLGLDLFEIKQKNTTKLFWFILGILCFIFVIQFPNKENIGWNLMLTYPIIGLGTLLIVYVLTESRSLVLINYPFINYLGKISYGLYIYHLLCLVLIANFFLHKINVSISNLDFLPWIILLSGLSLTIDFIGNKIMVIVLAVSFCGQLEGCVNYKQ